MTSQANVLIDLFEEAAMNLATTSNQSNLDKLQSNRKSLEDYIEELEQRVLADNGVPKQEE